MRIFFVFFLCCFSILFAEKKDKFTYVNYNKNDSLFRTNVDIVGYNGIPNYSKIFTVIDFIDKVESGIYIFMNFHKKEVLLYAYLSKESEYFQIYMEPSISRSKIDRFSSCIDKHVKNNIDFFKETCIQKKKINQDEIYDILKSYFKRPYEEWQFYCDDLSEYLVEIVLYTPDGQMQVIKFENTSCLDESLYDDYLIKKVYSLDSIVKTIVDKNPEKCNWRNLVVNPKLFSSKKYNSEDYLILSDKDCPIL